MMIAIKPNCAQTYSIADIVTANFIDPNIVVSELLIPLCKLYRIMSHLLYAYRLTFHLCESIGFICDLLLRNIV